MFTKQHYKAIAEIIKGQIEYVSMFADSAMAASTCNHTATKLANYFAEDNSRFDREKFINACGLMDVINGDTSWKY